MIKISRFNPVICALITSAPRPGAIQKNTTEAERVSHRYQRLPILLSIFWKTFQRVSSPWNSRSVRCFSNSAASNGSNRGASFLRPPVKVPIATGAPRFFKSAHKRWVGVAYRYLPNSTSTQTVTPSELLGIKRGAGGAVIKPGTLGHWQVFL